jgi:hypothetical protein
LIRCPYDERAPSRGVASSSDRTTLATYHLPRKRRGVTLELTYQAAPSQLTAGSLYRETQAAQRFPTKGGLIPDLVIKTTKDETSRWLVIEVKAGAKRSVAGSARAATLDWPRRKRTRGHMVVWIGAGVDAIASSTWMFLTMSRLSRAAMASTAHWIRPTTPGGS